MPVGRQTFLACVRGQTTGLLHRRYDGSVCFSIAFSLSLWDVGFSAHVVTDQVVTASVGGYRKLFHTQKESSALFVRARSPSARRQLAPIDSGEGGLVEADSIVCFFVALAWHSLLLLRLRLA